MTSPGSTLHCDFTTQDADGNAVDADLTPTGTLVHNGIDTEETVDVVHKEPGVYRAAAAVPAGYAPGDQLQIRIAATVEGVAGKAVVWSGVVSTLQDLAEADRIVDTAPTPWELVYVKKGTGGLGVGTELLRQQLKDISGADVTDTSTVIARLVSQ